MPGSCEGWLCGFCLAFSNAPRVVGSCQCSHRRRTDAIPTHVHLLGFCERLAIGAVADDVVAGEALGFVQLSRLQHPQADIGDHIRRAFDGHSDQCQAVTGGDGRGGRCNVSSITCAVVADQEGRNPKCACFSLRREAKLNQRALAATARNDGGCRIVQALADTGAEPAGTVR